MNKRGGFSTLTTVLIVLIVIILIFIVLGLITGGVIANAFR